MNDAERVAIHIDSLADGEEISDACARVIASWWHGDAAGVGYSFVSTGAILDSGTAVWRALTEDGKLYDTADAFDKRALDYLGTYLVNAGQRGPVNGWSDLWL